VVNSGRYAAAIADDPRYAWAANQKPPPKVGSRLDLFDCLTCDKCVPVCPNDANFTYTLPAAEIPVVVARPRGDGGFTCERSGALPAIKAHQIGNFADFCNECGNCDVFCPEDGGPYLLKPRFFGSREQWAHHRNRDGFFVERQDGVERVWGRFAGREYTLAVEAASGAASYGGAGFALRCTEAAPEDTLAGESGGEVDLTYFHLMNLLRKAILSGAAPSYLG
jgi:putative selenate reductase